MQRIFIGEYIRCQRKKLGLTQEQICDGICDATTLSRIENGRHTPSKAKINALLQRLGLPDERYYAIESKKDMEIEALKKEVVGCNITDRVKEGFEKIEQLEKLIDADDCLTKQFVLRSKVLLGKKSGLYSLQEQLDMLSQAIYLTLPLFRLDEIHRFLYTFDEVKIINQIALVYSDMGQHLKAIGIYSQLLKYVREHYQEVLPTSGMLQLILYNYARELGLLKHYQESIRVAEEGREACIRYAHYQLLPGCLAIMAECYFFLEQPKQSEAYYRQAYYIYKGIKDEENLRIIEKEAMEHLNLLFEN